MLPAMILFVSVAVYGAALGLWLKPGVRAIILAAVSVATAQFCAIWLSSLFINEPSVSRLAWAVRSLVGVQPADLAPTASIAAFAAALTAVVSWLSQSGEQRRRVRRVATIDD